MTPAQRVMLDRRIAEEGMTEIEPHGEQPWDLTMWFDVWQPHAWTMNAAGQVARGHIPLDEVSWHDVVAVRLEDRWGNPIDVQAAIDGDDPEELDGDADEVELDEDGEVL